MATFRTSMKPVGDKAGTKSSFNVPISNSMGLDAEKSRNMLKILALNSPTDYALDRQKLFDDVVKRMVETSHDLIWELLSEGKVEGNEIKIVGTHYVPNTPAAEIAQHSNKVARAIYSAWLEIFEKVLPDSFANLADNKMKGSVPTVNMVTSTSLPPPVREVNEEFSRA